MVAALSRFGTFANLGVTSSSASDGFPNTPSPSFHGAKYTSGVVSLTGYETTTNLQQSDGSYPALDPLSTAGQALFSTYDFPPGGAQRHDAPTSFVGERHLSGHLSADRQRPGGQVLVAWGPGRSGQAAGRSLATDS